MGACCAEVSAGADVHCYSVCEYATADWPVIPAKVCLDESFEWTEGSTGCSCDVEKETVKTCSVSSILNTEGATGEGYDVGFPWARIHWVFDGSSGGDSCDSVTCGRVTV